MSSECGVVCSTICWMRPSRIDEHHVERDVGVLHPHADRRAVLVHEQHAAQRRAASARTSGPAPGAAACRRARPGRRGFTFLPSRDLELAARKRREVFELRDLRERQPGARAAQQQHHGARCGGAGIDGLAGVLAWRSSSPNSTRPAKSKLVSTTRSLARQAGGRPEAEAARHDAIHRAPGRRASPRAAA